MYTGYATNNINLHACYINSINDENGKMYNSKRVVRNNLINPWGVGVTLLIEWNCDGGSTPFVGHAAP